MRKTWTLRISFSTEPDLPALTLTPHYEIACSGLSKEATAAIKKELVKHNELKKGKR